MDPFELSIWPPLLLSLRVAALGTLCAFILASFLALFLKRRTGPLPSILDACCTLPLVLPPTVLGYYLILLVGRNGLLGPSLAKIGINLIFSWEGAVVAASLVIFPLIYKAERAALAQVDQRLEDAARTLGASELRIFLTISFPLAFKGIVAGLILAFARGMGEFGATLMIAGNIPGKTQTLSLAIYAAFQAGQDDEATILVIVTSLLCVVFLGTAELLLHRKSCA
ncbi:MAG: molybdate ABC transporter permease subunit [Desulfovibrionaceae bacterium]|nr:molybdate ABC transporter permease subunit [Desulfovibrionaceae bacterium]